MRRIRSKKRSSKQTSRRLKKKIRMGTKTFSPNIDRLNEQNRKIQTPIGEVSGPRRRPGSRVSIRPEDNQELYCITGFGFSGHTWPPEFGECGGPGCIGDMCFPWYDYNDPTCDCYDYSSFGSNQNCPIVGEATWFDQQPENGGHTCGCYTTSGGNCGPGVDHTDGGQNMCCITGFGTTGETWPPIIGTCGSGDCIGGGSGNCFECYDPYDPTCDCSGYSSLGSNQNCPIAGEASWFDQQPENGGHTCGCWTISGGNCGPGVNHTLPPKPSPNETNTSH